MKNIKILFLSILFVTTGIFLSQVLDFEGRKYYKIDTSWIEDTGTLTQIDHGKSSSSKFSYNYNGQQFNGYTHGYGWYGSIIGEKCIIKVNAKFPDKYIPLDWRPVFSSGEKTNTTIGRVVHIWPRLKIDWLNRKELSSNHIIKMSFVVNGLTFERQQSLPPDYEKGFLRIEKGNLFEVEYWLADPNRAIMHFDKPIKAR